MVSTVAVPASAPRKQKPSWKRLDLGGVSLITAAVIVFVYAVTSGSIDGWGTARVLAPLVAALLMMSGFFIYEAMIDPDMAALPPRIWKYTNVPILVAIALLPLLWWGSCESRELPLYGVLLTPGHGPRSVFPAHASDAGAIRVVSDRDFPALPTYRRMFDARRQLRSLSRESRVAKMGDYDWSGP